MIFVIHQPWWPFGRKTLVSCSEYSPLNCDWCKLFDPTDPRFAYATSSTINLLELKGSELIQTEVFSPEEDVVSFDVDWYRDWIYWANGTGQVKRISLTQHKTQTVATLKPGNCFLHF